MKTSCNIFHDLKLSNVSVEVTKRIVLSLDTSINTGINQIPAKIPEGRCKSIGSLFEKYN